MFPVMALAIWMIAVALVVVPVVYVHVRRLPADVGVTLSVLPGRTAVVSLDQGADPALLEQAVTEALTFGTVDVVEIRHRDGQLLDRRSRSGV